MWPHHENIHLPVSVFTLLRDLIHDRAGLYYELDKRELLGEKISSRVGERGFDSFLDYYYLLKYGPDAEAEWPHLLDALSVQETYFWREMGQIHALANEILPAYANSCSRRPIQIWSSACASGEEPFTIAMALAESGWLDREPVKIVGSDASRAAIAKARTGIYPERSMRNLPTRLKERYFSVVPAGWQITPELSSRVTFSVANLACHEEIGALAESAFIFCRNVFIYFSSDAIARTVKHFSCKMPRPGYLFLGASESLLKLRTDFELDAAGEGFVYTLKGSSHQPDGSN